jgi:hypothetical protein
MKAVQDLIPWRVIDLAYRPFGSGFWAFNPSIHFDGETWRCVLRCCDYCMPSGRTVRSKNAGFAGQQTKNAMVILDPTTWRAVRIYKMHERDGLSRATTPHVGFEDMRLFRTDAGGLQGIAASLHLQRGAQKFALEGSPQSQPPEQVIVSFDEEYNIVAARPIRGDGWSGPQKNWVPFDDVAEPRFLYSIGKGTLFDSQGRLGGDARLVRPSVNARPFLAQRPPSSAPLPPQEAIPPVPTTATARRSEPKPARDLRTKLRGGDVQLRRGSRMMIDAGGSHPTRTTFAGRRGETGDTRMMMNGRVSLPKYQGLRGGSQLIRVRDGAWLGVAHEMTFVEGRKFYWHVFYVVDDRGAVIATSEPCKLAPTGIEFAAGMAVDGDRVVISFGVDDMESKIAETSLEAIMKNVRPR